MISNGAATERPEARAADPRPPLCDRCGDRRQTIDGLARTVPCKTCNYRAWRYWKAANAPAAGAEVIYAGGRVTVVGTPQPCSDLEHCPRILIETADGPATVPVYELEDPQ